MASRSCLVAGLEAHLGVDNAIFTSPSSSGENSCADGRGFVRKSDR
jgi:hypothetical protein